MFHLVWFVFLGGFCFGKSQRVSLFSLGGGTTGSCFLALGASVDFRPGGTARRPENTSGAQRSMTTWAFVESLRGETSLV